MLFDMPYCEVALNSPDTSDGQLLSVLIHCLLAVFLCEEVPDPAVKAGAANRGIPPGEILDLGCSTIYGAAFSPDGSMLAVAAQDGLLRIFCAASRHLLTGFQVGWCMLQLRRFVLHFS